MINPGFDSQEVTVLATRWPNVILLRNREVDLDLLIDVIRFDDASFEIAGKAGSAPVRRMCLDMEATDRETVRRSDMTDDRKGRVLTGHGFVSDFIAQLERPELRTFFNRLERLVCLHVTDGVNDATGRENSRLISEARDRLDFTFDVPVVPAGFQDVV